MNVFMISGSRDDLLPIIALAAVVRRAGHSVQTPVTHRKVDRQFSAAKAAQPYMTAVIDGDAATLISPYHRETMTRDAALACLLDLLDDDADDVTEPAAVRFANATLQACAA